MIDIHGPAISSLPVLDASLLMKLGKRSLILPRRFYRTLRPRSDVTGCSRDGVDIGARDDAQHSLVGIPDRMQQAGVGGGAAMAQENQMRVAIGGFGAIGKVVARRLDRGIEGLSLAAVAARDIARAETAMADFTRTVPVVALDRLWEYADVVVECAPAALLREIAEPALGHSRIVAVLSCGALLDNLDLVDLARRSGGRILVPTGALLGLDAVVAAAEGGIRSVSMITRKPPRGLLGAPYLEANAIDITGLTRPKRVFSGTAREAARGFPANVNVAAALALAGIGPDRTNVEIWADPNVTRNTHRIEVESEAARFSMQVENVPSAENPRTGRLTALSVIAALKKLSSPLAIGT
jgi:aspartate dehydrogenase